MRPKPVIFFLIFFKYALVSMSQHKVIVTRHCVYQLVGIYLNIHLAVGLLVGLC